MLLSAAKFEKLVESGKFDLTGMCSMAKYFTNRSPKETFLRAQEADRWTGDRLDR